MVCFRRSWTLQVNQISDGSSFVRLDLASRRISRAKTRIRSNDWRGLFVTMDKEHPYASYGAKPLQDCLLFGAGVTCNASD